MTSRYYTNNLIFNNYNVYVINHLNGFAGLRNHEREFGDKRRVMPMGGTLIFSYIRRLGPFFWGQIFEFQYFFGFSEK